MSETLCSLHIHNSLQTHRAVSLQLQKRTHSDCVKYKRDRESGSAKLYSTLKSTTTTFISNKLT